MAKTNNLLSSVLSDVKKAYGNDIVVDYNQKIELIPSGSIGLDWALGGGYPKGRIIELIGWESSGKTTLCLYSCIPIQKSGKAVIYIDVECALSLDWCQKLGVDIDPNKFIVLTPKTAEEALGLVKKFVQVPEVGMIIVDSVSSMSPKCVIDGEVGEAKMAVLARLMAQNIPTFVNPAQKNDITIMFINQIREKIGVMFGNPETTTGGNALKFYASQRLNVSKSTLVKETEGDISGNLVRVKIMKNKIAPPQRKIEFNIAYGHGIDTVEEVSRIAVEQGIITQKGSFYSYDGTTLCQGAKNLKTLLADNPELFEEIKTKLIGKLFIQE